jgi:eukaryotic-like serine/threonine-protein kinase
MKSPTFETMPSSEPFIINRPAPEGGRFTAGMTIAGRYRLERYLARGGMAEVWAAQHEGLRSEVAIKFVDASLASDATTAPYALERFRFEAQISAKISAKTRHVVAVHDAGENDGVPYLVMELVNGHTLEDEVERSGPLSIARCADMLDQVADALSAAHTLGIVHRDIKPSNVMLVDEPGGELVVKVADFGVAKSLRSDLALDRPRETAVGELIGSPAFMSPEQIVGDATVDARSDVWSLGVVTYEAVTGASCFEGANVPQLMMSIGKGVYRPASQMRPELPRGIDAFFARALAQRPENRFSSATELAAAFRALIVQPPRSNRGVAVTAIAIITAIACIGLFALLRTPDAATPLPTAAPSGALIIAPPHDVSPPVVPPTSLSDVPTSSPSGTSRVTTTPRVKSTASANPAVPVITPAVTTAPAPIPPPTVEPKLPKKRIDPSEIQ